MTLACFYKPVASPCPEASGLDHKDEGTFTRQYKFKLAQARVFEPQRTPSGPKQPPSAAHFAQDCEAFQGRTSQCGMS